jgi:hypothetical protein
MNIYENITVKEREMIANYIERYASFDGEATLKMPLDHILRIWDAAKVDLFNLLGKKLIVEKKMTFTKSADELEDEIGSMLNSEGSVFCHAFYEWSKTCFLDHDEDNAWTMRYNLRSLLNCDDLAKNAYDGELDLTIPTPDGHSIIVSRGCKVSKVLGKIAKAFNINGYEEFRIAHSQCLNQKKLTGDLCLSIHPLDFMTMSDNACGWSSCMSWQECGDYRQGTVEMMNSPYVVVAYLKSSENMSMPYGEEWASKKWRSLFIVTPYTIVGIREYPYSNDEVNGTALQWLRELAITNMGWTFEETAVKVCNERKTEIASLGREILLDFCTEYMYNDYHCERLAYISPEIPNHYSLNFSGTSECMLCGAVGHCEEANALVCFECDGSIWCDECGDRIAYEDSICVDGARVCEYCYENHFATCNLCEETRHENNLVLVSLRAEGEFTNYSICVCSECAEGDKFVNLFGPMETKRVSMWTENKYVDVENFTSIEALDQFDIYYDKDYEKFKAIIEAKATDEI